MLTATQMTHIRRNDMIPFVHSFAAFMEAPTSQMHDALMETISQYLAIEVKAVRASRKGTSHVDS